MTTIDAYLDQVLAHLPPTTPFRQQIALELRGHISERLASGQPLEAVLDQLGDPAVLAASYLEGLPLAPADFGARVMAKVIDAGIAVLLTIGVACISWLVATEQLRWFLPVVALILGAFGFVGYTIVAEWRTGQTFGKRRYDLHVVRENGAPIGLGQSVVRQLPVILEIFWIDALFVFFTERRQRAFELLSKTRVVRIGTNGNVPTY